MYSILAPADWSYAAHLPARWSDDQIEITVVVHFSWSDYYYSSTGAALSYFRYAFNKVLEPVKSRCLGIRVPAPSEADICRVLQVRNIHRFPPLTC